MNTWEVIGLIGTVVGYVVTVGLGYWLGKERYKRLTAEARNKLKSEMPPPVPSPDLPEVPNASLPANTAKDEELQLLLGRLNSLLGDERKHD